MHFSVCELLCISNDMVQVLRPKQTPSPCICILCMDSPETAAYFLLHYPVAASFVVLTVGSF